MTRKDFELIARAIREWQPEGWALHLQEGKVEPVRRSFAELFAAALAETNPQFDRERFLRAAAGEGWTPYRLPELRS